MLRKHEPLAVATVVVILTKIARYVARHHWGMIATFLVLGGVAYAAGTAARSRIQACVESKTGVIRLAAKGRCPAGERSLTWGKVGPAGPVGPSGGVGPSDVYFSHDVFTYIGTQDSVTVSVPAGSYSVQASCTAGLLGPTPGTSAPRLSGSS